MHATTQAQTQLTWTASLDADMTILAADLILLAGVATAGRSGAFVAFAAGVFGRASGAAAERSQIRSKYVLS
jgi:hypothetical protein